MFRNILQNKRRIVTGHDIIPDNLLMAASNMSWTPDTWTPGLPSPDEFEDTFAPVLFQNTRGKSVVYLEEHGRGVKVWSVDVKAPGKC